jgi:TonB-dependent receptor
MKIIFNYTKNTVLLALLLVVTAFSVEAQNGTVRGTVIDNSTGDFLLGVAIFAVDTDKGSITDLDGQFSMELPAGEYQLQLSYISYQTLVIENVVVKPGEVNVLGDIIMSEDALELEAVVVTAEAVRSTEAAIQTLKRKSAQILDGISASQLKLTGDGNAVEAAKRVTGVSVEDGKYVYVRGLGDRYSKVTLNGMDIPGLDPDRNSLQMDIFPTNLISNLMVSKSFTADLPADFTGGIMNVETKAFPERKMTSISVSTSFNPDMHFNPDNLSYEGGATDFLGFDDGTRALPAGARSSNIPTPFSGASRQSVNDFVNSFDSQLGAVRQSSLMDYSASFSTGNQISLDKNSASSPKLGYIFSLSYQNNYRYYDDVVYGEYQRFEDPDRSELRYATVQGGELGERDVLVGALAGLAYKTDKTKLRLTALHLQNGLSKAGQFSIDNDGEAVGQSGYLAASDNLEYNQRSLTNVLLHGKHSLSNSGWELDWRVSPTLSSTSDPDIRRTAFTFTPVDTQFIAGAGGNPSRIWRSLSEWNNSSRFDVSKDYPFSDTKGTIKFGVNHLYKQRSYEILFFDMQFWGSQTWDNLDPNSILDPGNIYPNKANGDIYYQSGNNDPNPNEYSSSIQNTALYFSNEVTLWERLKTVVGLRMENYVQRHTGRDQRYASGDTENGNNLDNEVVLESMDFFPSVNLIYSITSDQNIRLAYAKTIARPSFKEVSYAQILDPITNRIYNGSLFTYNNWDGQLTQSDIQNVDLRWEQFLPMAQIFSVSAFYKRFANPIELVRIPEQQTSAEFQPRNVGNGQLFGVELEFRKNLDFISPALEGITFNGNFTYVESQIDMTDLEFNARKNFERTGENIEDTRVMAGQAPYLVNLGVSYRNSSSTLETGLFYNVKGPTLFIVGSGLYPDVYQNPFHSLNFTINKKFGEKIVVDFSINNILDDKMERVYKSYEADDQPFDVFSPGISFGLGLNYTL